MLWTGFVEIIVHISKCQCCFQNFSCILFVGLVVACVVTIGWPRQSKNLWKKCSLCLLFANHQCKVDWICQKFMQKNKIKFHVCHLCNFSEEKHCEKTMQTGLNKALMWEWINHKWEVCAKEQKFKEWKLNGMKCIQSNFELNQGSLLVPPKHLTCQSYFQYHQKVISNVLVNEFIMENGIVPFLTMNLVLFLGQSFHFMIENWVTNQWHWVFSDTEF